LNNGLTDELNKVFPNVIPILRPLVENIELRTHWLAGFIEGEGCFHVKMTKSKTTKTGIAVQLQFKLSQHIRDLELMYRLVEYLNCGSVIKRLHGTADFVITKYPDISNIILPFYPLQGAKALDFESFWNTKVADLMRHLT
jgi:hypothetical protein